MHDRPHGGEHAPACDEAGPAERFGPTRLCVYAATAPTPDALEALRQALRDWPVVLCGTALADREWPGAVHCAVDVDAPAPQALVAEIARAFPGEHLVFLPANAKLPPLAIERLLRALESDRVLVAAPLDDAARSPLPPGPARSPALDALCYLHSARSLLEDAQFPAQPAAVSAWHGGRLAALGAENACSRDRVDAAGLRAVLLDHLYIAGTEASASMEAVSEGDAAAATPLAALRARLAAIEPGHVGLAPTPGLDARPVVLHVLHGWGGGAARWVGDYARADQAAQHLVLVARGSPARRIPGEWLELHAASPDAPAIRRWPLPRPIADTALADAACRDILATIVADFGVTHVVVSSLIGHSLDVLRTGLPTLCVIHDHYPLWPVLHRDFGDPALAFDEAQRRADLADADAGFPFTERDPEHWRRLRDATVAAVLAARAGLLAPSRSALANHLRLGPELASLAQHMIPHALAPWPAGGPSIPTPPARTRLRLVMVGRIGGGKGGELLAQARTGLAAHAELFLLGAGIEAQDFFGQPGVHVLLDYRREELPALLARLAPDAALLLPTVAETFSYTLSELRSLGVPVLATRVGALAERIRDGVDGLLLEPTPQALVARVAALAADPSPLAALRGLPTEAATPAGVAASYAAILGLAPQSILRYRIADDPAAAASAAAAAAEATALAAECSRLRTALASTRAESARRGEWGHALDRELGDQRSEHARAITAANEALAQIHAEFDERSRWALELDAELGRIRPEYERMLASRSWRLTAPLRAAGTLARRLRASLAFRARRLLAAFGRTRGSLARRGLRGTIARAAEELRGGTQATLALDLLEPRDDATPFTLPTSAQPLVSIVIPVYGKVGYTLACLRSIAAHAGTLPFEVIVVDDGSPDETPARLAALGGLEVIRNPENLGFIGSCNVGSAAARGDYLLFLNNDTQVTPGWLEALVRCHEEAPDAGLVGARLVYPDGRLQEAGGIVFSDASGWNYGRFGDPGDPRYGFRREADYCSGAAILIHRELFVRLGRFDSRYAPAYYEDTDLAFAVRAAGLRVYCEPAATVVHFEGISSGTDTASGTKRFQVVNQGKFRDKWQAALAHQPAPGTPPGLAATHRARHRVLIVDATTPTPDQDSGSLRMVNLMRVLASLGAQVSFLPENRAFDARYTPMLQALGVEALYAPWAQDPVKLLRERGREFDLVILSRHYVAASFAGLVRLHAPQARLAFDTVDLHYLREERAAALTGQAELARQAAATRRQELALMRECDLSFVVSPVEQELLRREVPEARVEVLSNVHEVHGCRRPFAARRDLLFVGGFQHPPNTDAVLWFVREVLPLVHAREPAIVFHVIGSKVPEEIRALAGERVVVHGYVEDLDPWMDGCRVSVAPLRYGAGVKGKVNMAMSCGLPVVATPIAVEGMHVVDGREVLVAESAADFAAAVLRLYGDEALWNALSAAGLANVEEHFSLAAARATLARVLGWDLSPPAA